MHLAKSRLLIHGLFCCAVSIGVCARASGNEPGVGVSTATMADKIDGLAEQLRVSAPKGFTMVKTPPFVVLGDESAEAVKRHAGKTVAWAVSRLRQDYFSADPEEAIAVWLFRDKASYERNTLAIFGEKPVSPYGYYSSRHRALIMNISTGGGTLVHEIVHPFMRANFPLCPPWYNEGLASLFEQSGERDGHMVGLVNWRLAGLQQAIREGTTLPFTELMELTNSEFYGRSGKHASSIHYGQARYLCYFLQQRGLLIRFHREFIANAGEDPSGAATLRRVVGEEDLEVFRHRWEDFVQALRYPAG